MEPVKVGLLGLGRGGQQLASAILSSSWCRLVAVASARPARLNAFKEAHPDIATYNDFRSLIVENALGALFVAVPPYLRSNYLSFAAERTLPVFMLTPAARRLDEAVELIGKFDRAGCPIVVSRAWGCEPAMQPDSAGLAQLGRVFLARGTVMTCWSQDLDWRGDSHRAGGGVLLNRAYDLLDTAVQTIGVPSTVFAMAAGVSRPDRRLPYDTEDTAGAVCTFAGGGIGVFSACWTAGPEQWSLRLSGVGGSIEINEERVLLRDRSGENVLSTHARVANPLLPQVEEFLSAAQSNPRGLRSTLKQHLPTIAVLEALYLSTKTGQPEQPGRIADIHDV